MYEENLQLKIDPLAKTVTNRLFNPNMNMMLGMNKRGLNLAARLIYRIEQNDRVFNRILNKSNGGPGQDN